MTDFATLIEVSAAAALVVAFIAMFTWLLSGTHGPSLPVVLVAPLDPPWPRGVQEEEPLPWRLDRLPRRSTVARPGAGECPQVGLAYPGTARPNGIG